MRFNNKYHILIDIQDHKVIIMTTIFKLKGSSSFYRRHWNTVIRCIKTTDTALHYFPSIFVPQ